MNYRSQILNGLPFIVFDEQFIEALVAFLVFQLLRPRFYSTFQLVVVNIPCFLTRSELVNELTQCWMRVTKIALKTPVPRLGVIIGAWSAL